jgi:uncharacterized protein YjbI with pentapeptide repeats
MDMKFIGKWTFTASNGQVVSADDKTGQLKVAASTKSPLERFNAYGTTSMFVLQASGGMYVAWSGANYVANQKRDGAPTMFALEDAGSGSWRVVDLGPKGTDTPYYWVGDSGPLTRVAKSGSPPATTSFKQTVVTPGIDKILQDGLRPNADLSWAYIGAVDFSPILSAQQADMTGAYLAGANFAGVALTSAILSGADMTKATLTGPAALNQATMIGTDLTGADMTDALMQGVTANKAILTDAKLIDVMLNDAKLPGAKLIRTRLSGFNASIVNVDFTGADLTDADFTEASVRTLTLTGADLTGVTMSNPKGKTFVDLSDAKVDSATNFTSAKLQYVDLSGKDLSNCVMTHVDLTGSKLDNVKLIGTELSYAVLDGASITGNIAMFGANFSNAQMTGTKLPGAQMGSISLLFRAVADSQGKQAYDAFLNALNAGNAAGVTDSFKAIGKVTLTAPVNVLGSTFAPGRAWTVSATGATYTVRLETISGTDSLAVYQPSNAAILTNAYMRDAVLTSANLFNVRASGVQLYGQARLDGQVILEGVQFDSANLSGVNLKQARLDGVNFGHATLTNAKFDGAWLTPDSRGGQASFANANLQGATFTDAHLADAILTDAAVAVPRTEGGTDVEGVWLFSTRSTATVSAQLTAATKQLTLPAAIAPQLAQGPVTDGVRNAFGKQGVTLTKDALVVVQDTAPLWTIADGATTYRVFEACDKGNYVPALGVSKSATGLTVSFTIPLYLERDLKTGPVADSVKKAFAAGGVTLGPDAKVSAGTMSADWQVVDTTASYDLWLGLNLDCALAISGRSSIPAVFDLFANHSLPLSRRATVTGGTGRWAIDNDSNNPFNPITNYIKANLVIETSGAPLDVYGSMLRVQRVGPSGTQVFDNVAIGLTKLGKAELQPSTVCPNSNRTKVNIGEKLPFKQWMRARELPKPPWCIPSADGAFYCPPSGPGRETRETEQTS